MLEFKACIYMVDLLVRKSLSRLHSCVDILRLVNFRGGGVYDLFVLCLGVI